MKPENWIKFKKVIGLHLVALSDGTWQVHFCQLENQKGQLRLLQEGHTSGALDSVITALPSGLPVWLVLDGKGVIHKVLCGQVEEETILQKVLPQAESKDFFVQPTIFENHTVGSVVRKNWLEKLLTHLESSEVKVCGLTLGPFLINGLEELMPTHFSLAGWDFEGSNGAVKKIQKGQEYKRESLALAEEQIPAGSAIPYLAALHFFLFPVWDNGLEALQRNREDWKHGQLFSFLWKGCLGLIFVIMLINAGLNMQLNAEHEQLTYQAEMHAGNLKQVKALQEKLQKRKHFLAQFGVNQSGSLAYLADQLAVGLPDGIQWTLLETYPLDKEQSRKQDRKLFQKERLHLEGICEDPLILNRWLKALEKREWVQAIQNQEFYYDKREQTGKFSFDVLLVPVE